MFFIQTGQSEPFGVYYNYKMTVINYIVFSNHLAIRNIAFQPFF